MSGGHSAPFTVQSMPVTANFANKPVLYTTSRWDYLNHYLPSWRKTLRYRLLHAVLALVGVYFFFIGQPLISAVAWAGSFFYRARYEDIETFIIGSQRPSFEAA